jgi:uncharacterized membrane protein YGL010W
MKTLEQNLSQYAAYHRDSRNVLTHFVGIPLIVLAVVIVLSRPTAVLWGLPVSPATVAILLAIIYYVLLDRALGIVMALFLQFCAWVGIALALQSTATWLGFGIGLFVLGWAIQFVGHYFENRKPAFIDDIMGLIIGPLFVAAELAFLIGLRKPLMASIEAVSGPVVYRDGYSPAPKSEQS